MYLHILYKVYTFLPLGTKLICQTQEAMKGWWGREKMGARI